MFSVYYQMVNMLRNWAGGAAAGRGRRVSAQRRHIAAIFAPFSPRLNPVATTRPRRDSLHAGAVARALTCAVAVALACVAGGVAAPDARAAGLSGKDGVFKVIKPPPRGARKRITIHNGVRRANPPGAARTARHGWFWDATSPAVSAADPARLGAASARAGARLAGGDEIARLRAISERFSEEIAAASAKTGVSSRLILALVAAESGGDPNAVSHAGAQGLGQLIPATAARFGVSNPFDPSENLRGAATYLAQLHKMFGGDALLALAAYNAGENAVVRHNGVPPFAETRDYVPIVLGYYHAAASICAPNTPTRIACGA